MVLHAAEIQIHGLDARENERFMDAIKPKLQFITSRPATSWRADDAAFQLHRVILRRGFPDSEVNPQISKGVIHLHVTKGAQFYFGKISTSSRTTLSDELLIDYFYQPIIQSEAVPKSKAPFIQEYVDAGVKNIENYLKSIGYWNAQVQLVSAQRQNETQTVDVAVEIQQGRRHSISPPHYQGAPADTQQSLSQTCAEWVGKPATSANLKAIVAAVNNYFYTEGYHFAKVKSDITHSTTHTQITFRINQGLRFKTRSIQITGYQDTKPRKIKRFYDGVEGTTYDAERIDKATSSLLQSGVFRRASITPKQVGEDLLDLHIAVEEAKTVTTSAYIGTDSYEGGILGLSYTDLNFFGNMWNLSARGEWTGRGLLGEVGITEPFFAGEQVSFNVRNFVLRRSPDGYSKLEAGLELSWTWSPIEKFNTRLYLGGSTVSTTSSTMTDEELGPKDYINSRIGLRSQLDLRDDPIMPYHGYNGELLTEFGSINGDADTTYFKVDVSNSYRFTLGPEHHLISRFDLGIISPQDSSKLPIDRRFFSGGSNSVRAVKERTLGPRSISGDPLGGQSYWVGSAEYVRQIKGPIFTSVFYDLGQVYESAKDLDFSEPTQTLGIGARVHLPIGPIRFEYGYNLDPKPREARGAFHFSIGASF
ncbi:BamA/OMP85 family outer membrane protein [Rubritalea marina]|uniref:BamA/OMP85 family outer membrane protein n=1 Tax=Rubritalea marina TaxID=361055 RepID=UPI0003637975|nr:BamA/TamA family outer membrane protein [Rubritalea marina]